MFVLDPVLSVGSSEIVIAAKNMIKISCTEEQSKPTQVVGMGSRHKLSVVISSARKSILTNLGH